MQKKDYFLFAETDTITDDPVLGAHMIRQTLQDVAWGDLDYLLLDFTPGTGEPQQTLLATVHIDGVIIVTTAQELSLMDTGRSLALFARAGVPILGIIENMSYSVCPSCGARLDVFDRPGTTWPGLEGMPLLGRVPLDRALSRRIDPWHPMMQLRLDTPQASAFRDIAERISQPAT
jgi:ATP-binding protein involved in chromosome partitioning